MLRAVAVLLLSVTALFAQNRVPPEMLYHRVWAVVPLAGKGTHDDPRRPMFAPSTAERLANVTAGRRPGVISYAMQISDDGKFALVEFVGLTPADLAFIVNSNVAGVKAFERGKATKAEVETEFRKYKAGFTLDSLAGRPQ